MPDIRWRKSHDPEAAQKFIAASMLALTLVLLVILGGINTMSYYRTVSDADAILTILAQNNGRFPRPNDGMNSAPEGTPPDQNGGKERQMSPETPYESRFFSVTLDENGTVTGSDTGSIAAINADSAAAGAEQVWERGKRSASGAITAISAARPTPGGASFFWTPAAV